MASCAQVLAETLWDVGVRRLFGLPGGEILDFIEAARRLGMEFVLTRHEATASFMADVTGQINRRPGVCVATLGPGAMNMILGVANAYLDRSPLIAITASTAQSSAPYATHQNLNLNAVYQPFTKMTVMLDGENTAAKVRCAYRTSIELPMGPVHIALPSDVASSKDRETQDPTTVSLDVELPATPPAEVVMQMGQVIEKAIRPIIILGHGLEADSTAQPIREFVEKLAVPTFVTPKAKGILPEDNPWFFGVCAGVAADSVIVNFFEKSDLLVALGFDPVESDSLWHHTMRLVSINPVSIAAGKYRPYLELVGDVGKVLAVLCEENLGPFGWPKDQLETYRQLMEQTLRPTERSGPGLSPYEVTLRLRELFPRDTIFTTDVGSIKFVTSQCWKVFESQTFFQSNGLSSMSYGFPAAMAAKLIFPERQVLCTVGDGGFAMTFAEIETCLRLGIDFVTVVYNDSSLSLISAAQQKKGYPNYGVDFGPVDFAAVCRGLGAWTRRVETMEELEEAVRIALNAGRPAVIDVLIDPAEYRAHVAPLDKELLDRQTTSSTEGI